MKKSKILIYYLALFFGLIFHLTAMAMQTAVVAVPVANMFNNPDLNSSVISQAIYGSQVTIKQSSHGWSYVNTDDAYAGWMQNNDLSSSSYAGKNIAKVKNLFSYIYREADDTLHSPIMKIPCGTILPIEKIQDERWIRVKLVGGKTGWIQQGEVWINPKPMTLPQMLSFSKNFVGLPFVKGGISAYGFDNSGFVQFIFRQIGIILPRDNLDQVNWQGFVKIAKEDLEPGDIIYFGTDQKITHSGIYLGNNKFISALSQPTPSVEINDMQEKHWQDLYITARRIRS